MWWEAAAATEHVQTEAVLRRETGNHLVRTNARAAGRSALKASVMSSLLISAGGLQASSASLTVRYDTPFQHALAAFTTQARCVITPFFSTHHLPAIGQAPDGIHGVGIPDRNPSAPSRPHCAARAGCRQCGDLAVGHLCAPVTQARGRGSS